MWFEKLKQNIPVIIVLIAVLAVSIGSSEGQAMFVTRIFWFCLGLVLGAWGFRAAYKGGPDRVTRRAIEKRDQDLVRARTLLITQPQVSYQIVRPYLEDTSATELHYVAAKALLQMGNTAEAREILFAQASHLTLLPLERFKSWEPLFASAGESEQYAALTQRKLLETMDIGLLQWLTNYRYADKPDELLEWLEELEAASLPEGIRSHILELQLDAFARIVEERLTLNDTAAAQDFVAQHSRFAGHWQWHLANVRCLLQTGEALAALEAAIEAYSRTNNPRLLAVALEAGRKMPNAADFIEAMIRGGDQNQEDGTYLYTVAWTLLHYGNANQGAQLLNQAMNMNGIHSYWCIDLAGMQAFNEHRFRDASAAWFPSKEWLQTAPFAWRCQTCSEVSSNPSAVCPHCGSVESWAFIERITTDLREKS